MEELSNKVSVIIPTYKRKSKLLSRAIKSIKNQSYDNYEIIVIDDNRFDSEFRREIQNYMSIYKNDPTIKYIQNKKNIGGALSRNKGVNYSSGKYITFLDDDDKYLTHKLRNQINFMIKNNCDFSFSDLMILNEKDKLIDYRNFNHINDFSKIGLLKYHLKKHITGTPTFMLTKECFVYIKGFENVLVGQEYHLMLKAILSDFKIRYLSKCDVIAYKHAGEAMSKGKNKIKGEQELYKFKQNYFSHLNKKDIKYIKFRHYAVLSFTHFKSKNFIKSFVYTCLIIVNTPVILVKEVLNFIFTRYKSQKIKIN